MTPPDEIFNMNQEFKSDPDKSKISLIIGAYRDDQGKPYVFPVVRKVEEEILKEQLNHEYMQMEGDDDFRIGAKRLVFGADCPILDRIVTVQTLSGTGALRIGARFLSYAVPPTTPVYISDPTWGNHFKVFEHSGLLNQVKYPYYDKAHNALNYAGMMEAIGKAPRGAIILLHACAHNPTGIDPTREQWQEIVKVVKEHELVAFLDMAYQGFATGDLEADAYAVRLFLASGLQFIVAQSFAKNIGLYGERIGALHVVCPDTDTAAKVFSGLQIDIRAMYSNPPSYGARIVGRILKTPALFAAWVAELKEVSERIKKMRQLLYDSLVASKAPGTWDHILKQIGMFSFTGLTLAQCEWLIKQHHIYLLKSGRISMAGINTGNVARLAAAITDAVTRYPFPKAAA